MIGQSDVPADLSQTAALRRLDAYLPSDALVVSSPLARAAATADALSTPRRRLPNEARFAEFHFGAWEKRTPAEIEVGDPALLRAFYDQPGDVRPPGGESWNEVSIRVNAAVAALSGRFPGRDIVAVAHLGVILTQLQHALGVPAREALGHRVDTLSVTQISQPTGVGGWHVVAINHRP